MIEIRRCVGISYVSGIGVEDDRLRLVCQCGNITMLLRYREQVNLWRYLTTHNSSPPLATMVWINLSVKDIMGRANAY